MRKTTVQKEVFIAEDGKEFNDEKSALIYEKKTSCLKMLNGKIPEGKQYHAVYIPIETGTSLQVNIDVFNITNPTVAKVPGWNLIEDNGNSSVIASIEDLMKRFTTPTPRHVEMETELEQIDKRGVAQFKKAVADIVMRNGRAQATPEAILGNMIMELQDLIR